MGEKIRENKIIIKKSLEILKKKKSRNIIATIEVIQKYLFSPIFS